MAGANRPFIFRFFFDSKDAKRGADEVADSLDGVGDALDGVSRSVDTEMDRVERRMRQSATTIGTSTEKIKDETKRDFKGLGAEVGETTGDEIRENIGEGLRNGDLVGAAGETLTSLTNGLTGKDGVAAGIGIGIGAAIVMGVIEGIKEDSQRIRDAMNEGVGQALGDFDPADAAGWKATTWQEVLGTLPPELSRQLQDAGVGLDEFAVAVAELQNTGDPAKLDAIQQRLASGTGVMEKAYTALSDLRKVGIGAGGTWLWDSLWGRPENIDAAKNLEALNVQIERYVAGYQQLNKLNGMQVPGVAPTTGGTTYPSWYGAGQVPGTRRPQNG